MWSLGMSSAEVMFHSHITEMSVTYPMNVMFDLLVIVGYNLSSRFCRKIYASMLDIGAVILHPVNNIGNNCNKDIITEHNLLILREATPLCEQNRYRKKSFEHNKGDFNVTQGS
jgi:hypothetical protein